MLRPWTRDSAEDQPSFLRLEYFVLKFRISSLTRSVQRLSSPRPSFGRQAIRYTCGHSSDLDYDIAGLSCDCDVHHHINLLATLSQSPSSGIILDPRTSALRGGKPHLTIAAEKFPSSILPTYSVLVLGGGQHRQRILLPYAVPASTFRHLAN
ncbi:hypothetical protein K474DRAFT_692358 [Panus rudis PR-1116 ss-1]|nr:hypothetical protein K474DRAFT_692358 [Panus rudis PR-1116 ss-1]